MQTSQHAEIRMQQRGIPEQLVRNIITYGSTRRVAGGAVARFMSNQLDRHKGVYVVMASDCIVTVGHRTKRFYN